MMLRNFMVSICFLVIVLLIGCGTRANETDREDYANGLGNENEIISTEEGLTQRTLTIGGNANFARVVEQARNMFNRSSQDRGYYLSINFERQEIAGLSGLQYAIDQRETRLRVEFMAGMAPDLIFSESFPLHLFAPSGFLTDFYTLIDNCNRLSRDDFFVNALKANEFRGGLYELPMFFEFQYIGINDNMPKSIVDSFAQLSYITVSDLFEFYFNFLDASDEFFYIGCLGNLGWRPIRPERLNFMNYIDFNTNTVNFTSSFIESIMLANRLGRDHVPVFVYNFDLHTVEHLRSRGGTHMFYSGMRGLNDAYVFINRNILFEGIPFDNFIPLANDYGSLVIDFGGGGIFNGHVFAAVAPLVWMPRTANTSLAWEFIYYLIGAFSEPIGDAAYIPVFIMMAPWGHTSFSIPIMRSLFEDNMRATFEYLVCFSNRGPFQHFQLRDLDIVIQDAIDKVYHYTNMPMVRRIPHMPMHLVFEHIRSFLLGIITEQEALSRANNALTLWFMEQ